MRDGKKASSDRKFCRHAIKWCGKRPFTVRFGRGWRYLISLRRPVFSPIK